VASRGAEQRILAPPILAGKLLRFPGLPFAVPPESIFNFPQRIQVRAANQSMASWTPL
jgi:hypothetical protein